MKRNILSLLISIGTLLFTLGCNAQYKEDACTAEIKKQLFDKDHNLRSSLNYPLTVIRFYRDDFFKPVWITAPNSRPTGQAMILLDCVLAYGLMPADLHPKELTYDLLEAISEKPDSVPLPVKIRFEMMLTDALITLTNHLHYGKLNPDYGQARLDEEMNLPFHAEAVILAALGSQHFDNELLKVQPQSKAYADLQYWMHLWQGQYQGDCYEVPEADVRRVAINMERLRWAAINDSAAYLHINVPSYTLTYHLPDTDRIFKVIVGKPSAPTPVLQGEVAYFATWPGRRIDHHSSLVFRIQNHYDVYLLDTPEEQLFASEKRALSNGPIVVEKAEKLAELLLQDDNNAKLIPQLQKMIKKNKNKNFIFNKPVPVNITYLTCGIKEGYLINYEDIYQLDPALEMALYDIATSQNDHS